MGTRPQRRAEKKPKQDRRESACKRGYSWQWSKPGGASDRHLAQYPLCVECEKQGRVTPAVDVDHIIPHRGDMTLFWNPDNWQSLCKQCHSKKTLQGE